MAVEPEVKRFLKKIVWSISLGLLWLFINLTIGIYVGLMVPEHEITIGNIIFYVWMALSLVGLIWVLYKLWKEKFPHG